MQCRLAILALYLVRISRDAGNDSWNWREESLRGIVKDWFAWESEHDQNPKWFIFKFGDVAEVKPSEMQRPGSLPVGQ